jgi:O-antigen/teichoic acid export membrane protein
MMDSNLRERTITGISWSAISQALNQGFRFAISIVLARILGPKVYGLIGMITVFTGFAAVFGDFGLGAAIIQRKDLEARHRNAAFWTNLTMGATLTLLMVALAPVVAWFYKEPALLTLTMVIAFKYITDSLCVVQIALLTREMRFRALAGIQIGSNVVAGLAGLGFALYGLGPWSLVAQTLMASSITLFISWRLGNWYPRFSFELRA